MYADDDDDDRNTRSFHNSHRYPIHSHTSLAQRTHSIIHWLCGVGRYLSEIIEHLKQKHIKRVAQKKYATKLNCIVRYSDKLYSIIKSRQSRAFGVQSCNDTAARALCSCMYVHIVQHAQQSAHITSHMLYCDLCTCCLRHRRPLDSINRTFTVRCGRG